MTVEVAGFPKGGAASTLQPDGVPVPGEGELPKMNWLPPAMPPPVAFCPVGQLAVAPVHGAGLQLAVTVVRFVAPFVLVNVLIRLF